MSQELNYAHNPWRNRIIWIFIYVVVIVVVIFGFIELGSHIKTHKLPVGGIQLSIPYSKYVVGETVTFSIKNNFNSPVYLTNQCPVEPLDVYRQVDGQWQRIHDTASLSDCVNEDRQIKVPANTTTHGSFAAWHNLFNSPGKYRVVAYVEYYDALPYQDFEIIAKPLPTAEQPSMENQTVTPTTNTNSSNSRNVVPTYPDDRSERQDN